jgi:hypothetical protein
MEERILRRNSPARSLAASVAPLGVQRLDDAARTGAAIVNRRARMGYPVEPTKEQKK